MIGIAENVDYGGIEEAVITGLYKLLYIIFLLGIKSFYLSSCVRLCS